MTLLNTSDTENRDYAKGGTFLSLSIDNKPRIWIAGSRNIADYQTIDVILTREIPLMWAHLNLNESPLILHGNARGVDKVAGIWAYARDMDVKTYPANWEKYGKAAGPIRNKTMAMAADAAILIWDGVSKGTQNSRDLCILHNIPYTMITVNDGGRETQITTYRSYVTSPYYD